MIGYFMLFLQMIGSGFKKVGLVLRQKFVNWLMRDVRLSEQKFGANTITLSPGSTDVARWSATQAATALGDLGMNTTTGKPQCWADDLAASGAANRAMAIEDDAVLVDGSNAMIGNLNLNSNKVTNSAAPTAGGDLTNKTYVDALVSGLSWLEPADFTGYVGNATVATLNGLGTVAGDTYVVTDSGTLTRGTVGVTAGDVVQDDGTNWVLLANDVGGFVPAGTRILISSSTALIAPLTEGVDDGKVAEFSGSSNTPTFETPVDGNAILIKGEQDVNENKQYVFDGTVPTGTWVQFGGAGLAHSGLSGLTTGDAGHTQFALLAGRAGGQSLQGGTAASEDLTLESTANATKGNVVLASGSDMQMAGDDDFVPAVDTQGEIGTNALRFGSVRAVTIQSGDHEFVSKERNAHWVISEETDRLVVYNRITKKCYQMELTPISKPDYVS